MACLTVKCQKEQAPPHSLNRTTRRKNEPRPNIEQEACVVHKTECQKINQRVRPHPPQVTASTVFILHICL